MLIRISLILAIIAALGVAALNFTMVKNKVNNLQTTLVTTSNTLVTTENTLRTTKRDLEKTTAQLTQTNMALVAAIGERDKAVAEADTATKRATDLSDKLTKATKELTDAKDDLEAYHASFATPGQAASAAKDLKSAQDNLTGAREENALLGKKIRKLNDELAQYINPNQPVKLPASLQGKVVVSDPKWDFVVLNVGEAQDVRERGQLLVSRNGKLVAKVIVRSVQKDRSIANVMPGWKLGEVMEGDEVIPAYPE
jgi:myosin heavy subunit